VKLRVPEPGELTLVTQVSSPDDVIERLLDFSQVGKDRRWAELIRTGVPHEMQPLMAMMLPGDELWLCHTRIAPLAGSRGVCVVRATNPISYLPLIVH
jgi:hypothetical protein